MEKALALNPPELRRTGAAGLKGFGLLYLGDEFCEQLLPAADDLERAEKLFSGRTVLVTPLLSDAAIDRAERLLRAFSSAKKRLEVVVNDLGLLHLLRARERDPGPRVRPPAQGDAAFCRGRVPAGPRRGPR